MYLALHVYLQQILLIIVRFWAVYFAPPVLSQASQARKSLDDDTFLRVTTLASGRKVGPCGGQENFNRLKELYFTFKSYLLLYSIRTFLPIYNSLIYHGTSIPAIPSNSGQLEGIGGFASEAQQAARARCPGSSG
jgi:hypothetical protein